MPSADDEALAAAEAAPREPDGALDREVFRDAYTRGLAERRERLRRDARATFRALDGWRGVRTEEQWAATLQQAPEAIRSGEFLLERLGGFRYLDPGLMAVLLAFREQLICDHGAKTAAEVMLVDSALISYYHTIRISGWIGDIAAQLEGELFGEDGLNARFAKRHGRAQIQGLEAEALVGRIADTLMPLLDRSNRMLIRNLKALRALQDGAAPSVSIGSAGQVNVAAQQVNAATESRGRTGAPAEGVTQRDGLGTAE